jgi:CheY-like chemotaxis protein
MDPTAQSIWFAGDLGDPWVADIADSLSDLAPIHIEDHGDELPDRLFDAVDPARVLIMHRSRLTPADVSHLDGLRRTLGPERWPRIVLCVSPYVRYAELECCASFVDLILPEATARETLPRQLARMLGQTAASRPDVGPDSIEVEVVSSDYEVRSLFREACLRAGYQATAAPTFQSPADLTVWDVPVLESRWTEQLERRSRSGPVVALLGFADRATVSAARQAGASACLDLPCAIDDLIHVLDRLVKETPIPARGESKLRVQPPHAMPLPYAIRTKRLKTRERADEGARWPEPSSSPRIPSGPAT